MGSRTVAALGRALLLVAAGAAVAVAWAHQLYATCAVAALVAGGSIVASLAETQRRPAPLPPSPAAPLPSARTERRLTALVDLSPAPLVTRDPGGRLHAVNRAARQLLRTDTLVAEPPAALAEVIRESVPGRVGSVALAGHTFALVTGDLAGHDGVTRLAALIDIEAELKAAEAATLRDLVQVLSHEIVNALTPIASLSRTAAEMLDDAAPDLPAIRDAVGTVARRAAGLHRFGEAYRALARLPPPEIERLEVAALAADLQRLFATRWPHVPLRLDLVRAPVTARADADQIAAALWAVLQNAAEAVLGLPDPQVSFAIEARGGAVAIDVADSGPGVPTVDAEAIFRPFFTTKEQGSGIGVPLARQILRHHGGDLLLVNAGEPGARFRAEWPTS